MNYLASALTLDQHRRLARHYLSRYEQMAKSVATAPRHVVMDYHCMWIKALSHKRAAEGRVCTTHIRGLAI